MAEPPNTQLGRYRLLAELGRGNMGVVYRAEDPLLDRVVAVKAVTLPEDAEERAQYERRFLQEAKAAGGLSHPNLVTVYDVGREGETAFMAMELVEGTELRDLMKGGRLPLAETLDVLAQVADGLAFVHGRGVVHRDIKPGNIMVTPDGRARIMDFGIARMRVSEVQTLAGSILGSPKYMSPEQVSSQRADHRSDIFSLGVVLYEAAAGEPPFNGRDVAALMQAIATATPRPASTVNSTLPPVLDFICSRALEKDPRARYQSASEMAADLRACRAQLPHRPRADAAPRIDVDVTTTVKLDAAAIEAAARSAAQASSHVPALRAGDLAVHLTLSRRFDSRAAYERLMHTTVGEAAQAALPPIGGRPAWLRWLLRPAYWTLAAVLAAAAAAAVAVAIV